MKNANIKLFIVFLAGILFSAITVFAATVNVSTNFSSNAVQYLQRLVIKDGNDTTKVVLDWNSQVIVQLTGDVDINGDVLWNNIQWWTWKFQTYCNYDWTTCSDVASMIGWSLWNSSSSKIYYNGWNVGIGINDPTSLLHIVWNWSTELKIDSWWADANAWITFVDDWSPKAELAMIAADGEFRINNKQNWGTIFLTNDTENMRISQEGDIGIWVSVPTAKLDVNWKAKFRDGIQIWSEGQLRCMSTGDIGKVSYSVVCLEDHTWNVQPKLQLCSNSGANQAVIIDVWSWTKRQDPLNCQS